MDKPDNHLSIQMYKFWGENKKCIKMTHWEEWSWSSLGFRHRPSGEAQGLYIECESCYTSAFSCHFGQSNNPRIDKDLLNLHC